MTNKIPPPNHPSPKPPHCRRFFIAYSQQNVDTVNNVDNGNIIVHNKGIVIRCNTPLVEKLKSMYKDRPDIVEGILGEIGE